MAAPAKTQDVQYVSDEDGNMVSVIVPIDLWQEIASERETAYLLRSEKMRQRLLGALHGQDGIPLEEVRTSLGI